MSRRIILATLALAVAGSLHAEAQAPRDVPYAPGTIRLEVDATNLDQRIFRVRETIPVQAGELTLLYPQWLPGKHSPRGPIDKIAGIRFSAGGKPLENDQVKAVMADAEQRLNGTGRLVVRASGTEPLIRIMAEAEAIITDRLAGFQSSGRE